LLSNQFSKKNAELVSQLREDITQRDIATQVTVFTMVM